MPQSSRVLITGIAGQLAGQVAARLEADERVEYVVGVDVVEPRHDLSRTEFVRADLANPLIAKILRNTRVDTVLHLALTAAPTSAGGRSRMKERNVIGTMQLVGAAQKAERLRRLVLRSTTAVYGSSHADPALFREDSAPRGARSGYSKDAMEVEGYVRSFARRRTDVSVAVLRFANLIGPTVDSPLTRYLQLPLVPTVLGYDPRLQLCHETDAVEVLLRCVGEHRHGTYNVAGPGIVYLSQAIRLAGRPTLPIPSTFVDMIATTLRRKGRVDFSADQLRFLQFGRVGDITRLRTAFGYEPKFSTRQAFDDFVASRRIAPLVERDTALRWERELYDFITRKGQETFLADTRST